ncbi:MAG: PorV/PorQ family protein [Candidatus Marinimicrobia bacterium]|nr:PorV/PorQ family protein [Candidatus Neomarinimicrobiota bacterium]
MYRLKIYWFIPLVFFLVVPRVRLFAFEKVGVTSFQFLKVMPDARSAAMGDATSSLNLGIHSVFSNPANLVDAYGLSVDVSYVDYFFDTQHQSLAFSWAKNGFAFAAMALRIDYGELYETTVSDLGYLPSGDYNPGLTGNVFNPGAQVYGLSFSQRLTDKFSYGIVTKYAVEDMIYDSKGSIMWDAGLLYDTKFRSLRLSAIVRHFGPQIEYYDYSYPLPQTMAIGISGNVFGKESLLKVSNKHRLTLAFELVQPRDYDQQYHVGMEYGLDEQIFLRSGYKMNYDTEGITFGAGVKFKGFVFDYSFSDYGNYLPAVHRLSLSYALAR